MDRPVSPGLKTTFAIHFVVAALLGLALWLVPGRFLVVVGWLPETYQIPVEGTQIFTTGTIFADPVMTRLRGAALIALAFSSLRGWRATRWSEVAYLVELEAIFCVLSVIAILVGGIALRQTLMPAIGWVFLVLLLLFSAAWIIFWWAQRSSSAVAEPTASQTG